MTFSQVLTTILGGFLLPFAILVLWGRLVERLGPFGGWLVAAIIIGPIWYLNHGMLEPLHRTERVRIHRYRICDGHRRLCLWIDQRH